MLGKQKAGMASGKVVTGQAFCAIGLKNPLARSHNSPLRVSKIPSVGLKNPPFMENINLTSVKGGLTKSRNRFSNFVNPGPIPEDLLYVPGFIEDLVGSTICRSHSPNRTLAFAGALAMLAHLSGRTFTDTAGTRTNL